MTMILMTNEDDTGSGSSSDGDQQKVGECDEVDDVVDMVMRGQKKKKKKERKKKMMILITMTIMVLGGRCRSFSSATTATNALLDRCQAVVELQTVPYTSNDDVALSLGDSRSWFDLSPRESFYALCTDLKLLVYPQYDELLSQWIHAHAHSKQYAAPH